MKQRYVMFSQNTEKYIGRVKYKLSKEDERYLYIGGNVLDKRIYPGYEVGEVMHPSRLDRKDTTDCVCS